ncbi:MAG: hypothetical protein ACRD3J_30575, partial [Thermoanaerobaculia bacterium]
MKLGIENFAYSDLYDNQRLQDLALAFDRYLDRGDGALFQRFESYRIGMQSGIAGGGLTKPEESALLIAVSRPLGKFLEQLFQTDATSVATRTQRDSEVARFKKEIVAKRVAKVQDVPASDSSAAVDTLVRAIAGSQERDLEFALAVTANRLLDFEREYPRSAKTPAPSPQTRAALGQLRDELRASGAFDDAIVKREYVESTEAIARESAAVHAMSDLLVNWLAAEWKAGHFEKWTSFRLPKPLVFDHLVETEKIDEHTVVGPHDEYRRRDGFKLTDPRMTPREITDEANYCIYCHERKKDSCSTG